MARGRMRRDTEGLRLVGMDEKRFGRGQDYISVLTDLEKKRVRDVVEGRDTEAADRLWDTLSEEELSGLDAAAMDMWSPFLNTAARRAPQANVVHERFHVSKYLNEAVDQVRRAEHRALLRRGKSPLTSSRHLWLVSVPPSPSCW